MALSEMVKSLRTQMRDVMEALNALASSSNQIATITVQLASGSEETAVAVTETIEGINKLKEQIVNQYA